MFFVPPEIFCFTQNNVTLMEDLNNNISKTPQYYPIPHPIVLLTSATNSFPVDHTFLNTAKKDGDKSKPQMAFYLYLTRAELG